MSTLNPSGSSKQDIGGIYSDGRCPLCKGSYVDDLQSTLRCPDHPQHIAGTFKVKLRGTTARFDCYVKASNHLKAMRDAIEKGAWQGGAFGPSLGHVQDAFLDWKQDLVTMGRLNQQTVTTYNNRLSRIVGVIGVARRASEIKYRHVHGFLYKAGFAPKSTYDSYVLFKEMMQWGFDMGDVKELPRWPKFDFSLEHDMKRRKTINKETQARILHRIREVEWEKRPRLYLAIRFLATYINIRPKELLAVNEEDFCRDRRRSSYGLLTIKTHKTSRRPKVIRLLPQDISLLEELSRGLPYMPLFRYDVPHGIVKAGTRFGQTTFYRAWKRACKDLGVKDVDLYGGTRHSSAVALYKDAGVSPEEIKKATGHKTSIAFSRYFKLDIDDVVEIHALASPDKQEEKDGKTIRLPLFYG